jgi:hypothetical protein
VRWARHDIDSRDDRGARTARGRSAGVFGGDVDPQRATEPVDDRLLGEVRTLFGVRTTLSFGALAALLGVGAYGCSRSPGAC